MTPRSAFTAIEMLLAVALGAGICAAAFAAVRVASRCTTHANRLSIENRLTRAGILSALDQLDTWRAFDDWDDPARQPLRDAAAAALVTKALPFRTLVLERTVDDAEPRLDLDCDQSRPCAWWRGTPIRDWWTQDYFTLWGDYALFSGIAHPRPENAWYARTFREVYETLGTYALIDYLPGNAIYQYLDEEGRVAGECLEGDPWDNGSRVVSAQVAWNGMAHDVWETSDTTIFALTTRPEFLARGVHKGMFLNWLTGAPERWKSKAYLDGGQEVAALLAKRPPHWPEVSVTLRRFMQSSRFFNLATVAVTDPVSGERRAIGFSAFTTTLRGARQQRGLDVRPANGP